ncbi:MAG: hypothetical protein JXB24_07845 [Bacteroidales bacterium]|nr:hypothetical protein [Bacteroidales bacterium]
MHKQIEFHFVWMLLYLFSFALQAQDNDWELARKDDDIKVYLHSDWKINRTYRADVIINAPIEVVYNFLTDFDNYINWVYCCNEIEVLLEEKDKRYAYYAYYDIPWPFNDRDAISVLTITHNPDGSINVHTTPGIGYKSVVPDVIRIEEFEEFYHFIPLSGNRTKINMKGKYNPGGYIPDWLIKQFLTMGPLDALQEVKKHSEEIAGNK